MSDSKPGVDCFLCGSGVAPHLSVCFCPPCSVCRRVWVLRLVCPWGAHLSVCSRYNCRLSRRSLRCCNVVFMLSALVFIGGSRALLSPFRCQSKPGRGLQQEEDSMIQHLARHLSGGNQSESSVALSDGQQNHSEGLELKHWG